jgi:hypothetical protein
VYQYLDLALQKRPSILHSSLTKHSEQEIKWLVQYSSEISKQLEAINPHAEETINFKHAINLLSELNRTGDLEISLADFIKEIECELEAWKSLSSTFPSRPDTSKDSSQKTLIPFEGKLLADEYEEHKKKLEKGVADELNDEILEYISKKTRAPIDLPL